MQGTKPKKKRSETAKLNPGWRPGRKKRRRQLAATMIQKCFRSYLLKKAFKLKRNVVEDSFNTLKAFHHARDRHYFRHIDLHKLSREELRLIALSINVPSTGKKVLLMGRIQRWIDQNVIAKNLAVDAAARAHEKLVRAQGTVYFCEAIPGTAPIEIRPLRGRNVTSVAAGHECDAIYAIDAADGAVWLCKTGGLSSQVGLCSETQPNVFDHPLVSQWLVNPVFLYPLRTEHIVHVNVARSHAVALARAGELFTWGENPHGQLGFPAASPDQVARNRASVVSAISSYTATSVAVGSHHTIAVCDQVNGHDGVVFSWGSNVYGQLGTGGTVQSKRRHAPTYSSTDSIPLAPPLPPNHSTQLFPKSFVLHRVDALRGLVIRSVACGALHSMALSQDGALFTWGCNDGGRLGLGPASGSTVFNPTRVGGELEDSIVLGIACGAWHSACIARPRALPNNQVALARVYTWGTGIYGQLGVGQDTHVLYFPMSVRVPNRLTLEEEEAVSVACGMHHTSVLTAANSVYSWGSMESFSATPQKLRLADGSPFGTIASIACGRTFTVFNTRSRSTSSYEGTHAHQLWKSRETVIPPLDFTKFRTVPLCSSTATEPLTRLRLEPARDQVSRAQKEHEEQERIDAIDIDAIIHPLCRVCWRCNGFAPSPLKLWICRICFHEKELHGPRAPDCPLGEYEAVRKIQCLFRARRAKRVLQLARERHYERVFSIRHNQFFYYNLWRNRTSWERPSFHEVPETVEIPIRDPDLLPIIRVPLTVNEAACMIQNTFRMKIAQTICLEKLHAKYEKHFDLKKECIYYQMKSQIAKEQKILWNPPLLLRTRYDLGEPIEITRLKKYANLSPDDAARVIQRLFHTYQARQFIKRMIQARYRKIFDEETGMNYYYNTVTHESSWEKPKELGPDEDVGTTCEIKPRKKHLRMEKFNTEEAAARTIQALCRRVLGRKVVYGLLRQRFRKLMDENTQRPYYYDRVAGTSSWIKPAIFGSFDLAVDSGVPTTRTGVGSTSNDTKNIKESSKDMSMSNGKHRKHIVSISEKARRKRDKRFIQRLRQSMSPDYAVLVIQCAWRCKRARKELKKRLLTIYEKIYDDTTGNYYYYNKQTERVSWEKPALLEAGDVRVARLIKRKRDYTITDSIEAKHIIGGFIRSSHAKTLMYARLRARIQKVWDPETKQFYYFDQITGQSSWKKPLLLKDHDL